MPNAALSKSGPARDEEGFLLFTEDWSPALAEAIAEEEGLILDPERREVVMYVRDYYERNLAVPELRTALRHFRQCWGAEKATRKHMYRLFPYGYGQQACKIAGMRKPRKLMLDV